MKKEDKFALLAYLAVCIIWGSTYLAIRIGVQGCPPELFAGIRFIIAGGLMLLFAWLRKLPIPSTKREISGISIVGLLLLLGGNGLVVYAEQWVHSGITALILATLPLFMALIELIVIKEQKMDFKGWIGLLIGFGGVCYMVLSKDMSGAVDIKGALLLILACISWASGSVYSKTFKVGGSVVAQIGIQMLAGGIGLTIAGLLLGEASHFTFNRAALGSLLYLIVFGSLIGYSSYIYLLQKWPAAKAGTYAYVNPVIAVILGAVVLGEALSITVIFSTVIILAGVLLVQMSKSKKQV